MKRTGSESGFTLIEVLVAVVILSISLAAMIPMLLTTVRANFFGRCTTQAASYSQDLLEKLRAEPFELTPGGTPTVNPLLTPTSGTPHNNPSGDAYALPAGFTRTYTVATTGGCYSTGAAGNLIGIEVTTTWTDNQGVAHISKAFTVKSDN